MIRATPLLALLALLLTIAPPAAAQRVIHRVRFGETFTGLAKQYYGNTSVAPLLALVNGRPAKAQPRAGERLRLPTAWMHVVSKRTHLKVLARDLLGSRRRVFALKEFNPTLRGRYVRAGHEVLVPFVLTHTTRRGETFVALAQRFYGTRQRARLIARYNSLRGNSPPPEHQLAIPIARIKILDRRLTELTNERVLGVTSSSDDRREAVQEANALIRRGEYARVPLRLLRMLAAEHLADSYIADVFKLLAIAYVALDKHDLAVLSFREALLRRPSLKLDAVRDSPKVIRAFVDAQSSAEAK
jgi:hypothetical protein